MLALLLAAALASSPGEDGGRGATAETLTLEEERQCFTTAGDPPTTVCSWRECSAGEDGERVCRRVTERSGSWCSCWRTRTECDDEGKNCREWKK
jgi:hypothetical protein